MTDSEVPFRLGYVPGATPAKWVRLWRERQTRLIDLVALEPGEVPDALAQGHIQMAITRPPIDRDQCHAIALYEEQPVVVVSRDHWGAALDADESLSCADLADEVLLQSADDVLTWEQEPPGRAPVAVPPTTSMAIELVAAGVGIVIVPQSLARLHHRKDVTYRVIADLPAAPVFLVWPVTSDAAGVDEFIGIVRGRTINSSRGKPQLNAAAPAESKRARSPRNQIPTRRVPRRRG